MIRINRISPTLKQIWAVSGILISVIAQGCVLSFPSCLLPALQSSNSTIKADVNAVSWIASSESLAAIVGFLLSPILMDLYGRKLTYIIGIIPGTLGLLILHYATNIPMIILGRVLGGITGGTTAILGPMFIGEYASPKLRQMFLYMKTTSMCFGTLIVHVLGYFIQWRDIALLILILYLVTFLIIVTSPESPTWLASKNRYEECEKAFLCLREDNEHSKRELEKILQAHKEDLTDVRKKDPLLQPVMVFLNKFTQKDFLKPTFMVLFASILLEASGKHIIAPYGVQIIKEITDNKTQSFYYTLLIDIIIMASATTSSVMIRIFRVRTLLFTSGFAAVIILICFSMYDFLMSLNIISNTRTWIPLTLFAIYFVLSNLGCTSFPVLILGEVYPFKHKAAGSIVSGVILSSTLTMALNFTPHMLDSLKIYGTFGILGTIMGLTLSILFFTLPETKNRTLQEIEEYFKYGKFNDEDDEDDIYGKMI